MEDELFTAYKKFMNNGIYDKAFSCLFHLYGKDKGYFDEIKSYRSLLNKKVSAGENVREYNGLLKKAYLLTARDKFDDFMIYLEWNRPVKEKYWLPRRSKLLTACGVLQDMEDGKIDELFLSMPPRVGKALANDTPVLTRNGWKKHGDLVVGDEVINPDGKFSKVTHVHPKCMLDVCVEFTNGEKIICHENHEWKFYDRGLAKDRLLETKEWEKRSLFTGEEGKRGHRYVLQLPYKNYIEGEHKDLVLDPYTFGVWLGDGANKNPRICGDKKDKAIIDKIVSNGLSVRWSTEHKTTGVMYYDFDMRKQLQTFGLCHSRKINHKYIPDEYLTASIEQRLELLAGLLDTDGSLVKKDRRYQFTTNEETLRDSFVSLVSTFGWRCSISVKKPKTSSSGITAQKEYYVIAFNPDCYIPCALERKQLLEYSKPRKVAVKSITRVEPQEGNCITVERDGMYLCGKTLIPTHNTTIINFFMLWIILRDSERSNLYCSYTDSVVQVFYNGLIEMLTDNITYLWKDVFPECSVASTNAMDKLININRKKRYASFTGRSLYGTLNGACDCNGYEIADDLISGIEEAMNKDRLNAAWLKVDNNYLPRAKQTAKRLWIGTRWSMQDPIARRIELLENDDRYKNVRFKVINLPALNENDESNFEYACSVGFDTEYYKQRRASFERNNDLASWLAQYQGSPIERDGSVFSPEDLRYYNGVLPEADPDRIFMAVDPAWGGGDYVAAPVCYQFGDDIYVADVVYDNGDKRITQPLIVGKAKQYGVQAINVEATKTTSSYTEGINDLLVKDGIKLNINSTTKHFTGTGKEQRIFDKAPEIRERMIFLASGHRNKAYELFMQNVFSFTLVGKNKNDDAPDSLAMAIQMAFFSFNVLEVKKRRF